jgi:hypothetical protein
MELLSRLRGLVGALGVAVVLASCGSVGTNTGKKDGGAGGASATGGGSGGGVDAGGSGQGGGGGLGGGGGSGGGGSAEPCVIGTSKVGNCVLQ